MLVGRAPERLAWIACSKRPGTAGAGPSCWSGRPASGRRRCSSTRRGGGRRRPSSAGARHAERVRHPLRRAVRAARPRSWTASTRSRPPRAPPCAGRSPSRRAPRTSASRCPPASSACSPAPPRSARCCVALTTRSGSTPARSTPCCSPGAGCGPRASRSCSRCAPPRAPPTAWTPGWSGWRSARSTRPTPGRCSAPGRAARPGRGAAPPGAAGNPLALIEIPTLLSDAQLAGREPLESPLRPGTGIQRAFRRRVDLLPEATRRALLVAAASEAAQVQAVLGGMRALGLADARARARRGRGPRPDRQQPARLPPPAAALDRLLRRDRGGAPCGAPRAGDRRRGGQRRARLAPRVRRRRAPGGRGGRARGRRAGRPPARRDRHGRARLRARGAALPRDGGAPAGCSRRPPTRARSARGRRRWRYLAEAEDRTRDALLRSEIRRRRANIRIRTALAPTPTTRSSPRPTSPRTDPLRAPRCTSRRPCST